uniref:Uncharacterized protein n=1 Tax=Oryzias latipes TaxID=8090 RepID=A0A3P9HLH5_ORYLA
MDKLTIPKSLVWNPDMGIDEDTSDSGSIREDPLLILMSSGEAVTTTRQRLTSTCQLNLLLFPFDVQRCNITFSSTSFDTSSLKLGTARNSSVITSLSDEFMITQGEWNLKNMQVFLYDQSNGNISVSKLRYTVWLERKPMLYVINLILPLFYLLILDLASFFISESSGEKLGFKVTILLSISVLLLILNDILPSTEDKLPMIGELPRASPPSGRGLSISCDISAPPFQPRTASLSSPWCGSVSWRPCWWAIYPKSTVSAVRRINALEIFSRTPSDMKVQPGSLFCLCCSS